MNFPPPVWARDAAEEALRSVEGNHYAPAKGRPRLRKAIKEFYGTQFGKELDPETEIVVTSGANEGALCYLAIRTTVIVPADPPPHPHPLLLPTILVPSRVPHMVLSILNVSRCRAICCVHGVHRAGRRGHHLRALLRPVPTVRRLPRREVRLRPPPPQLPACPKRQDWEAVMDDRL